MNCSTREQSSWFTKSPLEDQGDVSEGRGALSQAQSPEFNLRTVNFEKPRGLKNYGVFVLFVLFCLFWLFVEEEVLRIVLGLVVFDVKSVLL